MISQLPYTLKEAYGTQNWYRNGEQYNLQRITFRWFKINGEQTKNEKTKNEQTKYRKSTEKIDILSGISSSKSVGYTLVRNGTQR